MRGEKDEPGALGNAKSWFRAGEGRPLLEVVGGRALEETLMSEGIFAVNVWLKLCF